MTKKAILILALMTIAGFIYARGTEDTAAESSPTKVKIMVPNGATLATIAMLNAEILDPLYDVQIEVIQSSDLLAARIISGDADFAVVPSNLAAVLHNKGVGIRLVGPVVWGLLYIVTSDDLKNIADLRGQTVTMIGRGLTPDITFRHLLEANGLVPDKDVIIKYAASAAELAPAFLAGKNTVSMMPEPMITTVLKKKPDTSILVDMQQEWSRRYGTSYPQVSLVVSGDFADVHTEFLAAFVKAFDIAVENTKAHPQAAGTAAHQLSAGMNASVFAAAIPRMNLQFIPAAAARKAIEDYYQVLFKFDPATIGGKLPSDAFYLP